MPTVIAMSGVAEMAAPPPTQAPAPAPHVTLCSIIPWYTESREFNHAGDPTTRYCFPATYPGDKPPYKLMRIFNTWEWTLNPVAIERLEMYPRPITAQQVAADIVDSIAGHQMVSTPSGKTLGLQAIAGDKPTLAELAEMDRYQTEFLKACVEVSDRLWIGGKPEERSKCNNTLYRRCLEALIGQGKDNAERHPWYVSLDPRGTKPCPACGDQITVLAQKCKHCGEDLVEFYIRREKAPPASDTVVAEEVKRILDLRAKRKVAPAPPA